MFDISIITQLAGLAIVDAINPCALAVMTLVLMSLLLHDPKNKSRVLWGGLMFTLAVFILYFLYGFIIIQFFKNFIPATGTFSLYVFKGFGTLAILLGILNVRDYFKYRPGSIGTEMPLSMRPRVKLIIKRITSPLGAFAIGMLVTVFLLPCTIGPYFIFSGLIHEMNVLDSVLLLLFYNLIFIIPMLAITFGIYFGTTTIGKISGWKDKNIKKLHLLEGFVLIVLGILIFTGLL